LSLDSKTNWDLESQRKFWDDWDTRYLQASSIGNDAIRRGETVLALLQSCRLETPHVLELGCGNGWLAEKLMAFGPVTGVDIADGAIQEARKRVPNATFYAGDSLSLDLPSAAFDAVLTLETFSHVPSQPRFVELMARVLKPGGYLILTTQNRTVYTRRKNVRPPAEGQIRHWVTMNELRSLVQPHFQILKSFTIQPGGDSGFLRLVNSEKVNRILSIIFSKSALQSFKERCGWGQTLVLLARKRA